MPFALVATVPAAAVATCQSSISPNSASAQAGLKVGCLVDNSATATLNTNHLEIHDALNVAWHRGAARTVTVTTAATTTITFVAGQLGPSDLRRPMDGTGIAGGAFVRSVAPAACTTACTSAVLSKAGTAAAAHQAKVEHTSARILQDASYTLGAGGPPTTSTLTSPTAIFTAADVNKSVSGGAFSSGARISAFTNATTVTVTPGATAAHATADDTITLGANQYTAASPSLATTYTETYTREMVKAPTGSVTCAGSTLSITAAGGGFVATDVGLKVQFLLATGVPIAGAWKINSTTATTAVLSAPCSAGAWTHVVIGQAGGSAPINGATMASLVASLNLNPALVAPQDDCNKNTYEGFQVVGAWNNPGSFAVSGVLGAAPDRSIAQILFPTSVLSFAGFIVPKATDTHQAGPHFDFVFPTLPTSLAVCPIVAGTTTIKTALTLGFFSTTLATVPFLPTGGGNPSSPPVRASGPLTGLFGQKVSLYNNTTQLGADIAPTGCTVIANTATPTFSCGLG